MVRWPQCGFPEPVQSMPPVQRTAFFDHIRVVLTALVILHHCAIMFGAPGGWYLTMPTTVVAERVPLTMFVTIDQAFFMGFFFLLSGYFSAASLERHGAAHFVRERLLRLGLPIIVYGFIIGPMTTALAGMVNGEPFMAQWSMLLGAHAFELGPLWFALTLLYFSAALLLWRQLSGPRSAGPSWVPGHGALLAAALFTGAGAFILRLWMPVGSQRWLLQIAYFSSYIVLFAAGVALAPSKWLELVGPGIARPWRAVSYITIPLLFVYGVLAGALEGKPFNTSGGWNLPTLAYAFWEPFVAWGIILTMLWRFRLAARRSPVWGQLGASAFAAFIIHPPVLVVMGLLLAHQPWLNSIKFFVAGVTGVALSFLLARALLAIPGARRIL
jgi:fucose 4-O-acetylase-like acetyltransferase